MIQDFEITGSAGAVTLDYGDGSPTGQEQAHTYAAAGDYTVAASDETGRAGVTRVAAGDPPRTPKPVITEPADGATMPAVFTIAGDAVPDSTVDLWSDELPTVATGAATGGRFVFDGDTPAGVGQHSFYVVATDPAGAESTSDSITVTVSGAAAVSSEDVPGGTITEILAWVGEDPARAQQAYDVEQAKTAPRSTLLGELRNRGAA